MGQDQLSPEALFTRSHNFCLQELGLAGKWLCASGIYWNCVIYNYIKNGCFRTDIVNYLLHEKWSLYAVIL